MKKTICTLVAAGAILTQTERLKPLYADIGVAAAGVMDGVLSGKSAYDAAWQESEQGYWVPATITQGTNDVHGFFKRYCIDTHTEEGEAYRNRVIERNPAHFIVSAEPYANQATPLLIPGNISMINRCNK